MGADGWRVKLLHEGRNVGGKHGSLLGLAGARGFRCEDDLQPWSHDSKALVFLTWDEDPVYTYDVAKHSLRHVPCGSEFVHSVQWSPTIDRLLVRSATRAALIDLEGNRQGTATWNITSFERADSHWTTDGRWFFVLARESANAKGMLTFYAGADGTVGEAHQLDPFDLVPYDAEQFADLPRQGLCLVVSSSVRSVGQLLDTWHGVQFHQPSGTLYVAVYRPISPPYRHNTEWLCKVEERWVAVELAA
jgi:hypothetical protein